MQGVILAGGKGTRLAPLTDAINKHLLPVGTEPMIWYAIRQLAAHPSIEGIKIITSQEDARAMRLATNTLEYLQKPISIVVQPEPKGIGDAIRCACNHPEVKEADGVAVLLGDNLFSHPIQDFINGWEERHNSMKAMCLLGNRGDRQASGVATIDLKFNITSIVEKPKDDIGGHIVPGFYCFDNSLGHILGGISPSPRGEYEITDILSIYLAQDTLDHMWLTGDWIDCGTIKDYIEIQKTWEGFVQKGL